MGLARAGGLVGALLLGAGPAWSIAIGQFDTFDADDELGWTAGRDDFPTPPSAGGGIITITGSGEGRRGGRVLTFNRLQWAGDYITAGVTEISLDLENLGSGPLDVRLAFEELGAPPSGGTWLATISSVTLAAGQSGNFSFGIEAADLDGTGVFGTLMANAGGLRILSNPMLSAQGNLNDGSLGVDNILAMPEPSTALLVAAGLGTLAWRRRH